ncbi:MAG TPA: glycine--tRNA ligase subunit beta, partial [Candidatus Omnitrophica bacterium]|nr:glycine--tRNA ligase subunit beta [Candidatus Omnitrophota bacterium]
FVLELGTEELPPSVVSGFKTEPEKKELVQALLSSTGLIENGLDFDIYITPRRLIMYIKNLPRHYNKNTEGPPSKIAYDNEGNPTKALEGFLRKTGASLEDIVNTPEKDGERVVVSRRLSTKEVIVENAPKLIKCFESFKTMLWDAENPVKFPRPIRWVLALFGNEVVPVNIAGITASNITYGHRLLAPKPIRVKDARDLFTKLRKRCVIYDAEERKQKIEKYLKKKNWYKNGQLLEEVSALVEFPAFIDGIFDRGYLALPHEALIASMSKNQRIFLLEDGKGRFTNKFVAVINGNIRGKKRIGFHYEQVLNAKLKDALFFYNEDLKTPMRERAKQLNGVIFHKALGTYADKVNRMERLAADCREILNLSKDEFDRIITVCQLCKADLLTQMVGEFPSLQGIMGKYYSLAEGLEKEVAQAIEEHYKPRFADDTLPEAKAGSVVALLDKLDSVAGHFKAGNRPKGNWDLYALRRQSIGIIRIIIDSKMGGISLKYMFSRIFDLVPGSADIEETKRLFLDFMKERTIMMMSTQYNFRYDLIDAVSAAGFDDIYNFYLRLCELNNIIDEFVFEQARCVVERTNNIIKGQKEFTPSADQALLQDGIEKELFLIYDDIKLEMRQLIDSRQYAKATQLYGGRLFDAIHKYFDEVMVNVKDERLRANRLRLMKDINSLYTEGIADLARIAK